MIIHKKKIIFIHIPKTGGSAVTKFLKTNVNNTDFKSRLYNFTRFQSYKIGMHDTSLMLLNKIGPKHFNSYYKFCCVRNPYDLMVLVYLLSKFDVLYVESLLYNNYQIDNYLESREKLFEWTNERWIITLTKLKGDISIKEKEINIKNELLKNAKESKLFKSVIEKFDDAILEDIKNKKDDKN